MKSIVKEARNQGLINHEIDVSPDASNTRTSRPHITVNQWRKLQDFMLNYYIPEQGLNPYRKRNRMLLYYYVLMLISTGCRISGARHLKWQNVSLDNNDIAHFHNVGKSHIVDSIGTKDLFEHMQEWRMHPVNGFPNDDDYVFTRIPDVERRKTLQDKEYQPKGSFLSDMSVKFNNMLNAAEKHESGFFVDVSKSELLSKNGQRQPINLYSARHAFATMALANGVSMMNLSIVMQTSYKMTHEFYGHITVNETGSQVTQAQTQAHGIIPRANEPEKIKINIDNIKVLNEYQNFDDEIINPIELDAETLQKSINNPVDALNRSPIPEGMFNDIQATLREKRSQLWGDILAAETNSVEYKALMKQISMLNEKLHN